MEQEVQRRTFIMSPCAFPLLVSLAVPAEPMKHPTGHPEVIEEKAAGTWSHVGVSSE
jgi:hypothetical protein